MFHSLLYNQAVFFIFYKYTDIYVQYIYIYIYVIEKDVPVLTLPDVMVLQLTIVY
jgi:hypothetical protein